MGLMHHTWAILCTVCWFGISLLKAASVLATFTYRWQHFSHQFRFSLHPLHDWYYKDFSFSHLLICDPSACSSIHSPVHSWYHFEYRPGASNAFPTWFHIDPLHVITQGLIPTLWISRKRWDQTEKVSTEAEKEEKAKGGEPRHDNAVYTELVGSLIQLSHFPALLFLILMWLGWGSYCGSW